MAIFCVTLGVVYSKLFKTEITELVPFLSIGLVAWGLISSCLEEMPNLFVDNASYMKDMNINPLTILLRALTRNCIIFTHNLLIIVGIYLYFGIWPGWTGLLAIPGFMLVMLNLAVIGITISIIGARFRDVAQINKSLLQVIFFITPVLWFPRLLEEGSWIVASNPIFYFIDLIRSPLLGHPPQLLSWAVSGLTFLAASIIALLIYRSKRASIAFWV